MYSYIWDTTLERLGIARAVEEALASEPERFIIVVNWFEELKQRMGGN